MMIEKILLDYLTDALEVPVYMEVPADAPDTFVVIEKTGSGRSDRLNRSTIALQSYAATMYQAALLNDSVKEAMDSPFALGSVTAARLNSDYNYTDENERRYRYQAVYDVYHY